MVRLSRKTRASREKDSYSINSAIAQYNMHRSELSSSLHATKCKAVLLGDSGVGKSAVIDRFVNARHDPLTQVPSHTRSPPSASTSSPEMSPTQVPPPILRQALPTAAMGHCGSGEVQKPCTGLSTRCQLRDPCLRNSSQRVF